MTLRPTPEADALLTRLAESSSGGAPEAVCIHHLRRLERERDEARVHIEEINTRALESANSYLRTMEALREENRRLERELQMVRPERDAALRLCERARGILTAEHADIDDFCTDLDCLYRKP